MAAKPATDPLAFSVLVDGKVYPNWTEVRVSRGIDRMASEFELSVAELWDGRKEAWKLQPFTPCTLMIGDDPVLTGFIDNYVPGYGARNHQVRISGRSKTQDIIDCTPDLPGGQFSGYNLWQIAGAIAQPFGIRVHVLTEVGEPFYDATIDRHETGFQFLERLARLRGVLLCDDELGDLILTSAGRDAAKDALVQGQNILSATANLSGVQRFSEYRVKTTIGVQTPLPDLTTITPPAPTALPPTEAVQDQFQAAAEEAAGEDAPQTQVVTTTQAVAYDPGVPRFRPHVMIAESALSADMARRRAIWQAKYNAARGTQLHVDVQGWRQSDGKLWRINQVVTVRSPYLQIDMELLCVGVTFELRAGQGRTTRLDLGPIDGYRPDPGQVKAHRNRGQATIYNDLTKIPGAPPG